jgi:WD40 repeat protein
MKEKQRAKKRSSARLRYFLAALPILLVAEAACCLPIGRGVTRKDPDILEGHDGYVRSVVFSPDGKTLASGGTGNTVKLWVVDARQ